MSTPIDNKKLKLHQDLYDFYQHKVPHLPGESEDDWKKRIKDNPGLIREMIERAPLDEQIRLIAMRRALAVAGGQRLGSGQAGPNRPVAEAYEKDFFSDDAARKKFAEEQARFLVDSFDYQTPDSSAIFWTGVDPDKLAHQVGVWNQQFGEEMFGQLEATTDARFINAAFEWEVRDAPAQAAQIYFGQASERYGRLATGHVTSVQMWGLRDDSIFTTTEFPTLLNKMKEDIVQKKTPRVQDITIVVLDPVNSPTSEYKAYTNRDIGQIPKIRKNCPDSESRWIRGRQDCEVAGNISIPVQVQSYWIDRGSREASPAARRIMQDYQLIKRPAKAA